MQTAHRVRFENAVEMAGIASRSIDLVVTSPPYPMIRMWDDVFNRLNPEVSELLQAERPWEAFDAMHDELDPVWREVHRVLKPGGLACINIGDAVRKIGKAFRLYPNHSRILNRMLEIGFSCLPQILWRKQTNAPNKFMGSGMLPPNAYVTLEHEHILILKKAGQRSFAGPAAGQNRRQSAYFWEERNIWFSDVWMDIKGTGQNMRSRRSRDRSAAFPFEVPYRLINMFSTKGDTVLDPFLGTGTTMLAAMAAARNSLGYEMATEFRPTVRTSLTGMVERANQRIQNRLEAHATFVDRRQADGYAFKHINRYYGFAVMTAQETDLYLDPPTTMEATETDEFRVAYAAAAPKSTDPSEYRVRRCRRDRPQQVKLFS
jgi:DNA modification methylase